MKKTSLTMLVIVVSLVFSMFSSTGILTGHAAVSMPSHGAISIAFDDGMQNVYDYAFPLMRSKGIPGTFYIITDKISDFSLNSSYMSIAELQTLQVSGNEIGSHSKTHRDFPLLSTAQIRDECAISKQVLQYYGLSADNFAYPYGVNINNSLNSIVSQYYRSARIAYAYPGSNPLPTTQFQLVGFQGETGDSSALTRLENFVNSVYSANTWAIVYFHNVVPNTSTTAYTISASDFSQFLDYVVSKGVETLTIDQALDLAPHPSHSPSFSPTPPFPLGKTTRGGVAARQPPEVMVGSRFTSLSSGVASSISVYVTNPSGTPSNMKCGIYKESGETLLATTQEATIRGGFAGWQKFSFPTAPWLTGGASYSLVAWFGGNNLIVWCDSSWAGQSWYAYQAYGNFPTGPYSNLAAYGQENFVYSIYCSAREGPTSRLVFAAGAGQTLVAGQVSSVITVQRQDAYGNPVLSGSTTVHLSDSGSGKFYSDDGGTISIRRVMISQGYSSASFYYKDTKVGGETSTLTADAGGGALTGKTTFTITAGSNYGLVFINGEQTVTAGEHSKNLKVQIQNEYGVEVKTASALSISLSTTSTGGTFQKGLLITIERGKSDSADLWYQDTLTGTPTLTASAAGVKPAVTIFVIIMRAR